MKLLNNLEHLNLENVKKNLKEQVYSVHNKNKYIFFVTNLFIGKKVMLNTDYFLNIYGIYYRSFESIAKSKKYKNILLRSNKTSIYFLPIQNICFNLTSHNTRDLEIQKVKYFLL